LLDLNYGYFIPAVDNPDNFLFGRIQPYCNGYSGGAPFFEWVDDKHPGFVHDLGAYIATRGAQPWPGSEVVFQELVGTGIGALYTQYVDALELTLAKPIAECDFPE
jgi:hypothetical protein